MEAREASRGSAIKLAADLGGRMLGFGTALLIARSLTVAELGRLELALITAVIAAEVADLGLLATSSRDLVTARLSVRSVRRAKLVLTAAAAVAIPVVVLACGLESLVLPLVLYFVLGGWIEWLGLVLRVHGRPLQEAVVLLSLRASLLGLVALVAARGPDVWSLAAAHAASPFLALVIGAVLVARLAVSVAGPDLAPGDVLRASRPLAVNGILALLSLRIEPIVLGLWAGEEDVGLYAPAAKLVSFLLMIPAAICGGAMPAIVRELARAQNLARERTASTLALVAAPATVGLFLVPGVVTLFGPQYAPSAGLLRILSLAVPFAFMNALVLHVLIAAGRGTRAAHLTGVRVAVAVLAAAVLVPAAGGSGAAFGFTLAELALLLLGRRACAEAGVSVAIGRPLALGFALSAPMAVVVGILDAPDLARVAVGAGAYAAVVIGAKIFGSKPTSPR